jgi:predicted tellurium resistance membrane protein TerC
MAAQALDACDALKPARFVGTVTQIVALDVVFSLDSVVTAVGMVKNIWVMIAAIVAATAVMLAASGPLSTFIDRYASVMMLALSFLLLIGMVLVADGLGLHIPRGYIYAAMGFSLLVESLNLLAARQWQTKSNRICPEQLR